MKKILIFYITEHSGHHSAALAVKRALELKDPTLSVACVNAFRYCFPIAERIINRAYLTVIKRVPKIWEHMYDNPRLVNRTQKIKNVIHLKAIKKLKKLIEEFRPDVVAATQAFPCGLMADYKRIYGSKIPLIGILTDFAPHAFWVYDNVNSYIVPCAHSKELLVQKGVLSDKIKLLGIPIDPKFSKAQDRRELLEKYGLKDDIPVVMIMGGGHGLGPIKSVLGTLDKMGKDLQFIVVCGLNKRLYAWINRQSLKNRILNFRFTDQIDRLMSMASLIITKPGGITTAEALAKKLPMIILNPIPGQETRNTEILTKKGAAIKIVDLKELLPVMRAILDDRHSFLDDMFDAKAIEELSKPNSSQNIANLILSLC